MINWEVIKDRLGRLITAGSPELLQRFFAEDLNFHPYNNDILPILSEKLRHEIKTLRIIARQDEFYVILCQIEIMLKGKERPLAEKIAEHYPHSLVVFTNTDYSEWHFTNIKYIRFEKEGFYRRIRPFRRIIAGSTERLRTASERLALIEADDNDTALKVHERCNKAFDVQEVTRDFYKDFVHYYKGLRETLKGSNCLSDNIADTLTQNIFNRLFFLYYIQKKNFLSEDTAYLYKNFKTIQGNYYKDFLLPLFKKLSDSGFMDERFKNIPFLNGGLFEFDPIEDSITIPNEAFQAVFEDLLERYNFTVREDTELEQEVAIDPEMLGTIFEQLVLKDKISNVDSVTSDAGAAIPEKAAYFAPIANNYSGSKKTDVMISTDVLSEGFNLQDCSIIVNYDLHWNPVRLIQRAGRIDRIGSEADVIHIKNFLPMVEIDKEINLKGVLKHRIEEIHRYIGEDNKILDDSERLNEIAMYCIYEKGDIDEVEKDKDIGFSYDEAESLIKQLEKDRPEYTALIRKMQLGLRSAKTKKSFAGTYAFFRAGDIAKLLISTADGKIIDDFSQVIDELRCENECPEIKTNDAQKEKYFADLNKLRMLFKEALQTEKLKLKPHTDVLKTKKRLQAIIDLLSSEEVRENIEKLDRVLNEYFPHHLIPLLKRLNKSSQSDESYLNELIDIYNKERLGEILNPAKRDDSKRQMEFICGEILL